MIELSAVSLACRAAGGDSRSVWHLVLCASWFQLQKWPVLQQCGNECTSDPPRRACLPVNCRTATAAVATVVVAAAMAAAATAAGALRRPAAAQAALPAAGAGVRCCCYGCCWSCSLIATARPPHVTPFNVHNLEPHAAL